MCGFWAPGASECVLMVRFLAEGVREVAGEVLEEGSSAVEQVGAFLFVCAVFACRSFPGCERYAYGMIGRRVTHGTGSRRFPRRDGGGSLRPEAWWRNSGLGPLRVLRVIMTIGQRYAERSRAELGWEGQATR